jgi:hypothetical protein
MFIFQIYNIKVKDYFHISTFNASKIFYVLVFFCDKVQRLSN